MRSNSYKLPLLILLVIGIGHYAAVHYGWYWQYSVTDIVLHILAGVMFALFWFWIIGKQISSRLVLFATALTFAVTASVLWEMWEFGTYMFKVNSPITRAYYVPELADSLLDIISSFVGAAVTFFFKRKN